MYVCDGQECDKLPTHMVSSLSHLALLGLSLQEPSAQKISPHSLTLTHSLHAACPSPPHPTHAHILTQPLPFHPASFGPLRPRQTKPQSSHTPFLLIHLPVFLFPSIPPSLCLCIHSLHPSIHALHPSVSLSSQADEPSRQVVDGGVNSSCHGVEDL